MNARSIIEGESVKAYLSRAGIRGRGHRYFELELDDDDYGFTEWLKCPSRRLEGVEEADIPAAIQEFMTKAHEHLPGYESFGYSDFSVKEIKKDYWDWLWKEHHAINPESFVVIA